MGHFRWGGGINTFEVFFKSVTLQLALNVNEITNIALRLHYISVKFMLNWFIMDSFSARVQTRGYYLPILSYLIWFFNFFCMIQSNFMTKFNYIRQGIQFVVFSSEASQLEPPLLFEFLKFSDKVGWSDFPISY